MREISNHDELMAREPDVGALQNAYALLGTSPEQAVMQLEELANRGSVLSMLYLGNFYQRGPRFDPSKTEKWYRAAYDKRALNAFFALGGFYYRQGNYEEAEKIFKHGIAENDPVSMYWLASIYAVDPRHRGKSSEIKDLLERATILGHVHAKHNLGLLLMKGQYGLRNIPRGIYLFISGGFDAFKVAYRDPNDRRLW